MTNPAFAPMAAWSFGYPRRVVISFGDSAAFHADAETVSSRGGVRKRDLNHAVK